MALFLGWRVRRGRQEKVAFASPRLAGPRLPNFEDAKTLIPITAGATLIFLHVRYPLSSRACIEQIFDGIVLLQVDTLCETFSREEKIIICHLMVQIQGPCPKIHSPSAERQPTSRLPSLPQTTYIGSMNENLCKLLYSRYRLPGSVFFNKL